MWPRLLAPVPEPSRCPVSYHSCLCGGRGSLGRGRLSAAPWTAARQVGSRSFSSALQEETSLSPLWVRKRVFKYLYIVGSAGSSLPCGFSLIVVSRAPVSLWCGLCTTEASRVVEHGPGACGPREVCAGPRGCGVRASGGVVCRPWEVCVGPGGCGVWGPGGVVCAGPGRCVQGPGGVVCGPVVGAHGFSCPVACGIFLVQGWNWCPLHCKMDS